MDTRVPACRLVYGLPNGHARNGLVKEMGVLQLAGQGSCNYAASGQALTSVGVVASEQWSGQIESISHPLTVNLGPELKTCHFSLCRSAKVL